MTLAPIPDSTIVEIVDQIFLPVVGAAGSSSAARMTT